MKKMNNITNNLNDQIETDQQNENKAMLNKESQNHLIKKSIIKLKKLPLWLIILLVVAFLFTTTGLVLSKSLANKQELKSADDELISQDNEADDDLQEKDETTEIDQSDKISPTAKAPVIPTITQAPAPTTIIVATPTATQVKDPVNIPVPAPSSTPTPAPRVSNPPLMNISYPSEMQSITMNQDQTLCVVDVRAGGNTQGLQRKHQLNEDSWSSYVTFFTLCIEPKEGLNRLHLQYKNNDDDESVVYTRQFYFHRTSD